MFHAAALLLAFAGALHCRAGSLTFDSTLKDFHAKEGETNLVFSYEFTNNTAKPAVILAIRPSCGCTTMRTPPLPWTIPAGSNGTLAASIDLRGKWGVLTKSITVDIAGEGSTHLISRLHIPVAAAPDPAVAAAAVGPLDERVRNQLLAQADRQVVFRGDCAKCHSEPAKDKHGAELYAAACANCHDSPNRATMVPDLRALNKATPELFWQLWIRFGREQSLMPAFDRNHGGPLNEEQIVSLSRWLAAEFKPSTTPAKAPASARQ